MSLINLYSVIVLTGNKVRKFHFKNQNADAVMLEIISRNYSIGLNMFKYVHINLDYNT